MPPDKTQDSLCGGSTCVSIKEKVVSVSIRTS